MSHRGLPWCSTGVDLARSSPTVLAAGALPVRAARGKAELVARTPGGAACVPTSSRCSAPTTRGSWGRRPGARVAGPGRGRRPGGIPLLRPHVGARPSRQVDGWPSPPPTPRSTCCAPAAAARPRGGRRAATPPRPGRGRHRDHPRGARQVRSALARLPRKQAVAVVLRHSGLSYAEVAAALDMSPGSVGTTVRRAESALRKEMSRHASSELKASSAGSSTSPPASPTPTARTSPVARRA